MGHGATEEPAGCCTRPGSVGTTSGQLSGGVTYLSADSALGPSTPGGEVRTSSGHVQTSGSQSELRPVPAPRRKPAACRGPAACPSPWSRPSARCIGGVAHPQSRSAEAAGSEPALAPGTTTDLQGPIPCSPPPRTAGPTAPANGLARSGVNAGHRRQALGGSPCAPPPTPASCHGRQTRTDRRCHRVASGSLVGPCVRHVFTVTVSHRGVSLP